MTGPSLAVWIEKYLEGGVWRGRHRRLRPCPWDVVLTGGLFSYIFQILWLRTVILTCP